MVQNYKITIQSLKEDLISQLEKNGKVNQQNLELVNDYVSFYKIKKDLIKDVKKRGVTVEYNNGGGQKGYKKNESIAELVKVNAQMIKILQHLDIKLSGESNEPEL